MEGTLLRVLQGGSSEQIFKNYEKIVDAIRKKQIEFDGSLLTGLDSFFKEHKMFFWTLVLETLQSEAYKDTNFINSTANFILKDAKFEKCHQAILDILLEKKPMSSKQVYQKMIDKIIPLASENTKLLSKLMCTSGRSSENWSKCFFTLLHLLKLEHTGWDFLPSKDSTFFAIPLDQKLCLFDILIEMLNCSATLTEVPMEDTVNFLIGLFNLKDKTGEIILLQKKAMKFIAEFIEVVKYDICPFASQFVAILEANLKRAEWRDLDIDFTCSILFVIKSLAFIGLRELFDSCHGMIMKLFTACQCHFDTSLKICAYETMSIYTASYRVDLKDCFLHAYTCAIYWNFELPMNLLLSLIHFLATMSKMYSRYSVLTWKLLLMTRMSRNHALAEFSKGALLSLDLVLQPRLQPLKMMPPAASLVSSAIMENIDSDPSSPALHEQYPSMPPEIETFKDSVESTKKQKLMDEDIVICDADPDEE